MENILAIIILIFSVVIHEVSHGYAALYFGDHTARYAGRLTLNPIKHLDLWGSIIIPLVLIVTKVGFIIGWAKPVPYNPNNFKNPTVGVRVVAFAGPFANIVIALFFGLLIRLAPMLGFTGTAFYEITSLIVFINILLAVFNLIPIPPLDGSKILFSFLPYQFEQFRQQFERFGFFILLFFIFFLWQYIAPLLFMLFRLFTGIPF